MENVNMFAGWIGILVGFLAGAVAGLFFHKERWLGGYASWRRRMLRLGHISLFGIGFINLALALSAPHLDLGARLPLVSWLFVIGAATMPLCCYVSAFWKSFRHLFFVPVLSLVAGAAILVFTGFVR